MLASMITWHSKTPPLQTEKNLGLVLCTACLQGIYRKIKSSKKLEVKLELYKASLSTQVVLHNFSRMVGFVKNVFGPNPITHLSKLLFCTYQTNYIAPSVVQFILLHITMEFYNFYSKSSSKVLFQLCMTLHSRDILTNCQRIMTKHANFQFFKPHCVDGKNIAINANFGPGLASCVQLHFQIMQFL